MTQSARLIRRRLRACVRREPLQCVVRKDFSRPELRTGSHSLVGLAPKTSESYKLELVGTSRCDVPRRIRAEPGSANGWTPAYLFRPLNTRGPCVSTLANLGFRAQSTVL